MIKRPILLHKEYDEIWKLREEVKQLTLLVEALKTNVWEIQEQNDLLQKRHELLEFTLRQYGALNDGIALIRTMLSDKRI